MITTLFAGLGRRLALWGALACAFAITVWVLIRRGRLEAEATLAIRRAEARIRALQTSKDIRYDVQTTDRADLDRRADRWMRD